MAGVGQQPHRPWRDRFPVVAADGLEHPVIPIVGLEQPAYRLGGIAVPVTGNHNTFLPFSNAEST